MRLFLPIFCSGVEYVPAGSFGESVASTGVSVVASLRNAGGFGGGVPLTNQEIEQWLGDACNNIIKVTIYPESKVHISVICLELIIPFLLTSLVTTLLSVPVFPQDGVAGRWSRRGPQWRQHHTRERTGHIRFLHFFDSPALLRRWPHSLSRNALPVGTQVLQNSHEKSEW